MQPVLIRCPRNSKNNNGTNCYCRQYPFALYHGATSKKVLCCYATGICCYEENCGYKHIESNSLSMPCIFELNNRRCNDPKNCIFKLSNHRNQSKPKKHEQVYRYDIAHYNGETRFPRSKRFIDKDFDFKSNKKNKSISTNNLTNLNNINNNNNNKKEKVQIQTVYVPVPYILNNKDQNQQKKIDLEEKDEHKEEFNSSNRRTKKRKRFNNEFEEEEKVCDKLYKKEKESKEEIKEKEDEEEAYDMNLIFGMDENEKKQEIDDEIERTRQQYLKRGLKMPFHEKIKIKRRIEEKYQNMHRHLIETKQSISNDINNNKLHTQSQRQTKIQTQSQPQTQSKLRFKRNEIRCNKSQPNSLMNTNVAATGSITNITNTGATDTTNTTNAAGPIGADTNIAGVSGCNYNETISENDCINFYFSFTDSDSYSKSNNNSCSRLITTASNGKIGSNIWKNETNLNEIDNDTYSNANTNDTESLDATNGYL